MPLKADYVNGDSFTVAAANAIAAGINAVTMVPTATKISAYTAAVSELVPCDATTGAFTVTLPTAPAAGSRVIVKKIDSSTNAVTVSRGGSTDVFNRTGGSTSITLSLQFHSATLHYYSGIWYVIADDLPLSQLDSRFQAASATLTSFAAKTVPTGTIVGTSDTQTLTGKTLTAPVISTIVNTGTLTLPTSTDTLVARATTDTLTNKRVTPRINSTTSSATPSINVDTTDQFNITALAAAVTSMSSGLSGTPTDGQMLTIRFKDNGTGRSITWGASFTAGPAALLTTTVASKTHLTRFVYDSAASKWACVSSDATGY